MFLIIILLLIGYLLGSFPSGVWVGKTFYQTDIRKQGSGNSGTTNTFRVLGKKAGISVFLMDMLKGSLAIWIATLFNPSIHLIWFGLAAIVGHVFPVFAHFKGGKAIATTAGIGLALYPIFLVIMLVIWGLSLYLSSMVSLASLVTVTIGAFSSLLLNDWVFTAVLFIILIVIVIRHKTNIQRMIKGNENKVPWGLRKDK